MVLTRYITALILILLCGSTAAQEYQWTPEHANRALEQALVTPMPALESGTYTTYDAIPLTNSPVGGRRNANTDDPFGGEDIGDVTNPKDPGSLPLGDVPAWFMLLLSGLYVLVVRKRKIRGRD